MRPRSFSPLPYVAFGWAAAFLGTVPPEALEAQQIAYTRANVVDVASGTVQHGATLLVDDGVIRAVLAAGETWPQDARVVDLEERWVAPGLIDAHTHISNPEDAQRALIYGVTTARSMGSSYYADIGLRELARSGAIDAPEILAAGYHVRPPAGDAFFMSHPELGHYREGGIVGVEAVTAATRAIVDSGVDWIKTNATERAGLPDTDPRKQFYSQAEMAAMVEVAATGGIGVAAHAHGDAGALAAVRAGVRSIEHGTFMSEATLSEMAERGTYLVPTMAIVTDLTIPGGDYDDAVLALRGRTMVPRVREMVSTALRLGVAIVASTDTGYGPNSTVRVSHELMEFVQVGMTPAQALRSGTTVAAELLGIQERVGQLKAGFEADFIVLERDPLADIAVVQDVLMVVNNGREVIRRGDWGAPVSE